MDDVTFHPLTYLPDGDDVVVGRRDVDSYAVLPVEGAALLRRLESGVSPSLAAQWYAAEYGEQVDMDDFLLALAHLGFVRDDTSVTGAPAEQAPTTGVPVRWQRLGAAVFCAPAWAGYAVLVVAAMLVCVADPQLVPSPDDVFFVQSLLIVELTLMVLQIPLTLLHELFHVLAGRRLGLRTRVRLGNRFYFLVFETVMNGLVSVPRRQRYLPMLAGLLADLLVIAGMILAAAWLRGPGAAWPGASTGAGLALALAFTTLPRMLWQGYFFLRTDGYYLISTVTGCHALHEAAWWRLRQVWARLAPGPVSTGDGSAQFTATDLRVSRWYAPLMLLGYLTAGSFALLVGVPLAWQFLSTAVDNALLGGTTDSRLVVDSAVFLGLSCAQLLVALVLAVRSRRSRPSSAR